MQRNSAVNLDVGISGDGFLIAGGTTKRAVTVISGDVVITGGSSNIYTYPSGSCTLSPTRKNYFDYTSIRALNTTYNNTNSGDSILVLATVRCAVSVAGGNAYVQAKSDATTVPASVKSGPVGIESGVLSGDCSVQVTFPVSPGEYYRLDSSTTNGTTTLGKWFEMTF